MAFQSDVVKMFPQFSVPPSQRDLIRYLWWKDGVTSTEPVHMRMTRHVFGALSSMGCANVGMRAIAKDYQDQYGIDCGDLIRNSFYVDDCLHSVPTADNAIDLITRTCSMLREGQVVLGKFVSSSRQVIDSIDQSLVAEKAKVEFGDKVIERALGVVWNVTDDSFTFDVSAKSDRQFTRRNVLSIVASVFDPLGLVSPFILLGKQILQELCVLGCSWDDPLPLDIETRFCQWISLMPSLKDIVIPRCIRNANTSISSVELHTFCDGSFVGYGVCSYLRLVHNDGQAHVSLVFAKSRVAPVKPVTIPRLELCAAVLAVKVSLMLDRELQYQEIKHFYYSDSKVVLGYINNSTKRFHVFVANRVGFIQSKTTADQWTHIDGRDNPADVASRGAKPSQLLDSTWFTGPQFLQTRGDISFPKTSYDLQEGDKEVKELKQISVLATQTKSTFYKERLSKYSSFTKLIRVVATALKWLRIVRSKDRSPISATDLYQAKLAVVRVVQNETLPPSPSTSKDKQLKRLSIFVDEHGIKRVGGRLNRWAEEYDVKHPILVPAGTQFAEVLVRHCHAMIFHQGRGLTLNSVRQSGFFIIGGASLCRRIIFNCVRCKKLRGPASVQQMASLPEDRMSRSNPFDYCGVDFFGPFIVTSRRSSIKYYGCLFTCLYSRAVHVETCTSLSTDSFILALRRFLAIRGPIVRIRCDRGTNFVGASNELREEMKKMNDEATKKFIHDNNAEIEFVFNPPSASHFGGVFERQKIGSIRRVFEGILQEFGHSLNAESLTTFLYEASSIINSRPLSCVNLADESLEPLTPNHLLTSKSRVLVSPPGNFIKKDLYLNKHWRRVQYLANLFWTRWRNEYLALLQPRSKWTEPTRNIAVGDVVLIVDDCVPRNQWKLAKVIEVNQSEDDLVRSVRIQLATGHLNNKGQRSSELSIITRPIHKLILLLQC